MKRITNLFRKDLILGIKDIFVLLEVGFAVLLVLLLVFLIPDEIDNETTVYIHDRSQVFETFISENIGFDRMEELGGEFFVDSRDEIIEGMREEKTAMGLIITSNSDGTYATELLTQPYTTEAMIRYIELEMEDLFSLVAPPYPTYPRDVLTSVRVTALQEGLRDEIPFRKQLMPPILLMVVGIIGLFIMISMTGQERVEGTIRAFRVSPGGLWQFLLSKHLLLLAIGVVTFSIIYLPIMGFSGYLWSLLIILLTIIFGSSLGVILGTLFDSPMASILWVFLLMLILALPGVSFFAPVFSPDWLKVIPSYHTLFGLDAAMFPDNNGHIIRQSMAVLGGVDVVLFFLSSLFFIKLIGKEA